jgi:hypothetical protein
MSHVFNLRRGFPKAEITALAMRSSSAQKDGLLGEIGRRSRAAGCYTREDFLVVCDPPNHGMKRHCEANSSDLIDRTTRITLSTSSERVRIGSLMRLSGVSWHTASMFLHFTFGNSYPILTQGSIWSWGFDDPPALSFDFWQGYVEACRALASECHVSMRILVRALAQFAMEQAH